jgi:hypothetical protein
MMHIQIKRLEIESDIIKRNKKQLGIEKSKEALDVG